MIVDCTMREVCEEDVQSVYKLIEDVVVPLMTEEAVRAPSGIKTITEAIEEAAGRYMD